MIQKSFLEGTNQKQNRKSSTNNNNNIQSYSSTSSYYPSKSNELATTTTTNSPNEEEEGEEPAMKEDETICEFCLYQGEGNFTSYGYPLSYRIPSTGSKNCSYRVQRIFEENNVCELELIFHDFQVPILSSSSSRTNQNEDYSNECFEDYLEVGGKKFCGYGWSSRTEMIPFPMDQTEIIFHFIISSSSQQQSSSNQQNQHENPKGFWVEVKRSTTNQNCSPFIHRSSLKTCEERFKEKEFMISSPKFPDLYPNNADCSYIIKRYNNEVCALELTFIYFDLEPANHNNECLYDFIELVDHHKKSSLIGQQPSSSSSSTNQNNIRFCGSIQVNSKKFLSFPAKNHQNSNIDEKTLIFHSDKQISKNGFQIKVNQLEDCSSKTLQSLMTSSLIDTSPLLVYDIISSSISTTTTTTTTTLPPPPSCNICAKERQGIIQSYHYPYHSYRPNMFCTFTIEKNNPKEDCALEMTFNSFDLQSSAECTKDFLQINGQKFCGSSLLGVRKILPFSGPGSDVINSLVMVFRSNSDPITGKGFSIKYKQLSCAKPEVMNDDSSIVLSANQNHSPNQLDSLSSSSPHSKLPLMDLNPHPIGIQMDNKEKKSCDYIFNEKIFLLKSENLIGQQEEQQSKNYPINITCSYFVKKNSSKVCYIELSFKKFDVEASAQCQFDFLEVNNIRLCGSLSKETTRTYLFEGKEKIIKFHSDQSTTRTGFVIKVEQLECDGDVIIRSSHLMTSSSTTSTPLTIPTVPSPIMIHPTPNHENNHNTQPLFSHHSSSSGDRNSNFVLPAKSSSCNQFFVQSEFEISSPAYHLPYPPNTECLYYIKKQSLNVCRLEVTYFDFQVQEPDVRTSLCKNDFLDFNGVRMCGTVRRGEVRSYYFPDSE